jgi:predicted nucleic acid binding AN1-type Zn finger protein
MRNERANRKRRDRFASPDLRGRNTIIGKCPDCGKLACTSKAEAKRTARQLFGQRWRVYRCGRWWHMTSQDAARTAEYRERAR